MCLAKPKLVQYHRHDKDHCYNLSGPAMMMLSLSISSIRFWPLAIWWLPKNRGPKERPQNGIVLAKGTPNLSRHFEKLGKPSYWVSHCTCYCVLLLLTAVLLPGAMCWCSFLASEVVAGMLGTRTFPQYEGHALFLIVRSH